MFVINGEPHQVTADQFPTLVDLAVRIMKDASRDVGVEFTIEGLHASAPKFAWVPQATRADADVEDAFIGVARRIDAGVAMLEQDDGVPEWMGGATPSAPYQAAAWFGETVIDGVSFRRANGKARKPPTAAPKHWTDELAGRLVPADLRRTSPGPFEFLKGRDLLRGLHSCPKEAAVDDRGT